MMKRCSLLGVLFFLTSVTKAQFLMDMLDTTTEVGKGLVGIYKKFDHLRIAGYVQPQYQSAAQNGVDTYEGPDFGTNTNNRFVLRRSRIRIDYVHSSQRSGPGVQVVFQFDGNNEGLQYGIFGGGYLKTSINYFHLPWVCLPGLLVLKQT